MQPHPVLYQLNTRVYLSELSQKLARRATLADIPDAFLAQLAERLAIRTGTHVSSSTISRTLSKLGITRKKKSQGQRSLPSPETTAAL